MRRREFIEGGGGGGVDAAENNPRATDRSVRGVAIVVPEANDGEPYYEAELPRSGTDCATLAGWKART